MVPFSLLLLLSFALFEIPQFEAAPLPTTSAFPRTTARSTEHSDTFENIRETNDDEATQCANAENLFAYFSRIMLSRRARITLQEMFHLEEMRSFIACDFVLQVDTAEKVRRHRMRANEVIILQQVCSQSACDVYNLMNGMREIE